MSNFQYQNGELKIHCSCDKGNCMNCTIYKELQKQIELNENKLNGKLKEEKIHG